MASWAIRRAAALRTDRFFDENEHGEGAKESIVKVLTGG
jgi:hypothetical protein